MLYLTQRVETPAQATASVTLPIDVRVKSRIKVTLNDGRQAGLLLPRGLLLRGGDILSNENGSEFIEVIAADEAVSVVRCAILLCWRRPAITLAIATCRYRLCPASCAIITITSWTICCASLAWPWISRICRLNRKPAPTPANRTAITTTITIVSTATKCRRRKNVCA